MTEFNVWGTDVSMIDAEEFCVRCEHAVPGHYTNCDAASQIESTYALPADSIGPGRSGDIYPSSDGDGFCVALWDEHGVLQRRAAFATWRGADRVVQAWLKAGRTAGHKPAAPASVERQADFDAALARVAGRPTMHPSRTNGMDEAIRRDLFGR